MAEKIYPSDAQDRFMVRMPDGMRDEIAAAAKANNRSMNAEIVARLEGSYSAPDASHTLQLLTRLEYQLAEAEHKLAKSKSRVELLAHLLALHKLAVEEYSGNDEVGAEALAKIREFDDLIKLETSRSFEETESEINNTAARMTVLKSRLEELKGDRENDDPSGGPLPTLEAMRRMLADHASAEPTESTSRATPFIAKAAATALRSNPFLPKAASEEESEAGFPQKPAKPPTQRRLKLRKPADSSKE